MLQLDLLKASRPLHCRQLRFEPIGVRLWRSNKLASSRTLYEVQYVPLETFGGQIGVGFTNTTNSSVFESTFESLEEYVEYNISVRAYTSVGAGPFSDSIVQRTEEDIPSNSSQTVTVDTGTPPTTSLEVNWDPVPQIDQIGIIILYEVRYDPLETFGGQITTGYENTTSGSELMMTLEDLQEYVEYNISVRAYTSVGAGPFSDGIVRRTEEDTPSNFPQNVTVDTGTPPTTSLEVNWDPVPQIDQNGIIILYEIRYDPLETFGGQIATGYENTTSGSELMITLEDLQEYVEYNISVRAYTSVGAGPFTDGIVRRTEEDRPIAAPMDLQVVVLGPNELNVSWTRPEEIDINGVLRYYIIDYQNVDEERELPVMTNVTGDMTFMVLEGLNNFTNYSVAVAAFTIDQPGPNVSQIQVTDENVPGVPPQNVTVRNLSSTSIDVQWQPPPQELWYGILRGYIIRYFPVEDIDNETAYLMINVTDPTETNFTLDSLMEFVNYSIQVTAVTVGRGPFSDPIIIRTDSDVAGPVSLPPEVPTEDIQARQVTVSWDPPQDPNGVIITYTVNFVLRSSTPNQIVRKRQSPDIVAECINGGEGNINRDLTVPGDTTTPFATYEFRVQAETIVGAGEFSPFKSFSTPESVPTEPRNLMVVYTSTTSLRNTWEPPLCDYGIRTGYTLEYDPIPSDGVHGSPTSPHTLVADAGSLDITDLTINTEYNVTVFASTAVGPGELATEIGRTDEDAPPAVQGLTISSDLTLSMENTISVRIAWNAPSARDGAFNYTLEYAADQTPDYPQERRRTSSGSVSLMGSMVQYTIDNGLPYANYSVAITTINVKRSLPGPTSSETHRSLAIEPTEVTNLMANGTSPASILVTWDLPSYPNGPIGSYRVLYRQSDSVQTPPINSDQYTQTTVEERQFEITGLTPFTYYSIHVQAIGNGRSQGELRGAIVEEVLARTYATTPDDPPTVGPTEVPTDEPTTGTVFVYLPPPDQIATGPVIFYGVIVVQTRGNFVVNELGGLDPVNTSMFNDAGPYNATTVPEQTYYVTAAWDDPDRVPFGYIVGNESSTEVGGVTYLNARLRPSTEYAIFVRVEIWSDTADSLITDSDYLATVQTASGPINGPPEDFMITADSSQVLTFQWDPPLGSVPLTGYQLSCDPQPEGFPRTYNVTVFTDRGGVLTTESGFSPSTTYNCSVLASNTVGNGPIASAIVTTANDLMLFQLQIIGINCALWTLDGVAAKLLDILERLSVEIEQLCGCGFTSGHITLGEFQCLSQPDEVTYRARLSGTTSRSSADIIASIEEWIASGEATLKIQRVRRSLDSTCLPVAVETFDSQECGVVEPSTTDEPPPPSPTAEPSPTDEGSDTGTADTQSDTQQLLSVELWWQWL